jgi:hypothetical protein
MALYVPAEYSDRVADWERRCRIWWLETLVSWLFLDIVGIADCLLVRWPFPCLPVLLVLALLAMGVWFRWSS